MIVGGEDLVRRWLEGAGGARGYLRFPPGTPQYPMFLVERVAGTPDLYTREDQPIMSVKIYSTTKKQAEDVMVAVVNQVNDAQPQPLSSTVALKFAEVNSVVWSPDGDLARYVVDLQVGLAPSN